MSIVKSKHASNYTVLPNEIFTSGLSIEAIGLLSYFLSLPHNWVIYKTQLHTQLNMGREKVDRIFKELTSKGYLLTVKELNDKGQFNYSHIVYDKPYNGEPSTDEPYTGNPSTVNLPLQSKDIENTKEKKKQEYNILFDKFWNMYGKKVGRKDCERKFMKLSLQEIDKIFTTLPTYIASTEEIKFRKNPETYLNGKHWEDEIAGVKPVAPEGYFYNSIGELTKIQKDEW